MDDYKSRIRKSIEKFHENQLPKARSQIRKNEKPEKHIVLPKIKKWLSERGFLVFVTESSVYDPIKNQTASHSGLPAGWPDLVAISPQGQTIYIELKSEGRRSTLRESQRRILLLLINQNCFACVTDSCDHLEKLWSRWEISGQQENRQSLLINDLPPEPQKKNTNSIDIPF